VSSSANTPGSSSTTDDYYDPAPLEPDQLYQGEILTNVPILSMPKPTRWLLLRTRSGRRVDEALNYGTSSGLVNVLDSNQTREVWDSDGRGDFVMAVLDKRPVLVLSQNCDVQHKEFIQVAPIFPAQGDATDTERLKEGRRFSAFWIKTHAPEIPTDSYADLELMQAIHKSYIKRITAAQHLRLNAGRTRLLQVFITRYFGRPNAFDGGSDKAPATGFYLCVKCLYMDGHATPVSIQQGSEFSSCASCSGKQWVLKGR
jgi:hypothetical protein